MRGTLVNEDCLLSFQVKAAIACWTGEGSFVFTGSNSVIAVGFQRACKVQSIA